MNVAMHKIGSLVLTGFLITGGAMADSFKVTSPQLKEGARIAEEQVFNMYGCHGKNLSPALQWKNPPDGTKSFAVTVYDLDAPSSGGWWHWIIINIPANITELAKGAGDPQARLAPPNTIQLLNDFGKAGYGGPCPPLGSKPHRYEFTVYALKTGKLPLDKNSPAATATYYLQENLISKTSLLAVYGR